MEAYENTKETAEGRKKFSRTLEEYIKEVPLETRAAFDSFVEDVRKVISALEACEKFLDSLRKAKVEHVTERRNDLIASLKEAHRYIERLLTQLEGRDDPTLETDEQEDE